jgi:hypothetical protein
MKRVLLIVGLKVAEVAGFILVSYPMWIIAGRLKYELDCPQWVCLVVVWSLIIAVSLGGVTIVQLLSEWLRANSRLADKILRRTK